MIKEEKEQGQNLLSYRLGRRIVKACQLRMQLQEEQQEEISLILIV